MTPRDHPLTGPMPYDNVFCLQLDSCDNFDERREIRATIREVRAQIKGESTENDINLFLGTGH